MGKRHCSKEIGSLHYLINITIKLSRNTWINSDQITLSQIQLMIRVTLFPKYLCDNESLRKLINHPVSQGHC